VSTDEELSNFYNITWLLIDVGTDALRNTFCKLLTHIPLKNWLEDQYRKCRSSLLPYQWKSLRAADGSFVDNADSCDISLLSALIKMYFKEKQRPFSKADQQLSDIVDYLSNERNKLAHGRKLSMSNETFKETFSKLNEIFIDQMSVPKERLNVPFTVCWVEKLRKMEQHILNEALKNSGQLDRSVEKMLERLISVDESIDDFINYIDGILAEILATQRSQEQVLSSMVQSLDENLIVQEKILAAQSEIKTAMDERASTSKYDGLYKLDKIKLIM